MARCIYFIFFLFFNFLMGSTQEIGKEQLPRLSFALQKVLEKTVKEDSIDLIISVRQSLPDVLKNSRIIYKYEAANAAIIRTAKKNIDDVINDRQILFLDVVRIPKEELTTGAFDLSANRINLAHFNYPQINGSNIKASIKEQRFDTSDIDFKGRYFNSGRGAATASSHASIMATILAGGSNSSTYSKGAAWGTFITSSDFANLLPDPDSVYKKYAISVQNHSYGTGIENFYGIDAAAYDMSVIKDTSLLHIFSAGNSGTSASANGAYAGINGFANLSGSFKMSKNTISVGHIDSFYNVLPLSSKGPAYDGRVKPELVAFGEDGSSGAAALVSGAAVLVQDAYYKKFNSLPAASLVKAVLLNSAEDVGERGIDFTSGYGALSADAALKTISKNLFFQDDIHNNEIKSYTITVPAHSSKLKVTIAWTDTAASANAAKALVNDLDAAIRYPLTGEEWLPWVLNAYPAKDSLMLIAVRKRDTLNNVEQISIDNPQAGDYSIEIHGTHIINASQPFSIAYQTDSLNEFQFTYPTASDVVGGKTAVIRWQSNIAGVGIIEYSPDGISWQTITGNADLSKQYVKWAAPDTTALFLLRMKIPSLGNEIISDTFAVSKQLDLHVGFNCPDSFLLFWNRQPVANYQLYALGSKYLEPILNTVDTVRILQKARALSLHYSVAPLINGRQGLRSYTIDYTTQGVGCYLRTFFASLETNKSLLTATLGTVYNVASISFQKITSSGAQILQTILQPSAISISVVDTALTRGLNRYQFVIKLNNGLVINSTVETVYYFPDLPVIIYPNPALQNQPIQLIVKDPFTYSIEIYDVMGKKIKVKPLDAFTSSIEPFTLAKGLYFIKISTQEGKLSVQKLIVQ